MKLANLLGVLLSVVLYSNATSWAFMLQSLPQVQETRHDSNYYVIYQQNVTWQDAQTLCQQATPGGNLAVLGDDVTMQHVRRYVPTYGGRLWTAGRQSGNHGNNWTWVNGQQSSQSVFGLASMAGVEDEQCAIVSVTGVYRSGDCRHVTSWYLCSVPTDFCQVLNDSSCIPVFSNSSTCVVACNNQMYTWHQARNFCLHRNGDLVSLDDARLSTAVIGRIEYDMGQTSQLLWLGLRRRPWIWVNQKGYEMMTYTYWAGLEPDVTGSSGPGELCVAVDLTTPDRGWVALHCDVNLGAALCQAPQPTSNQTVTGDQVCAGIPWLDQKTSIITLSVLAGVVIVLLLLVASLIVCLRNAKRLNMLLGSGPKTYFDYFDFGFRRLMPSNQPGAVTSRTMVLTDDMLTSHGKMTSADGKLGHVYENTLSTGLDQDLVLSGKRSGSSHT